MPGSPIGDRALACPGRTALIMPPAYRWDSSSRRSDLPANWPALRRQALERDGYRCRRVGCHEDATDVDHARARDDHRLESLESLCGEHHRAKTLAEAQAAARELRAKAHHPREQHPARRR